MSGSRPRAASATRLWTLFCILLWSAGCSCGPSPREGQPCASVSEGYCEDNRTALNCVEGRLASFRCPAGCVGQGICDYSGNAAGDPCFDSNAGRPGAET
jgi:hypothetical protein